MDPASISLAVQLMLEDLDALKSGIKGKGRQDDGLPDIVIATEFFREELATQAVLASDRTMCESIAEAVTKDADTIRYLDPEQAQRDAQLDDELVDKLKLLYVTNREESEEGNQDQDSELPEAESSSWGASRVVKRRPRRNCTGCGEEFDFIDVARCPCSHEYCRGCLKSLFQASTLDESLYPPRCCQQRIPLDRNRIFLTPDLVGRFKAKEMELETHIKVYCHDPKCSTFVPPRFVNEVKNTAVCVKCNKRTCTTCKGAAHAGDCPQDSGVQQVLELAAQEGWQRCYNCFRIVELGTGCYHMTCRCRAQFCYLCGERWKTCTCQQWDERRLYSRAVDVVARDPQARLLDPLARQERMREAAAHLRVNHQCQHTSWEYRPGRHRCEECHDYLPNYIYECERCLIMACHRCRYNRL